ncbi:MAG: nuclear transport factor 2 family protein [Pseudomonadota bacterium]
MRPKQCIDRWFQRVWAEQDVGAAEELAAPDATFRGLEETVLDGVAEFRLYHQMMLDQFDAFAIEVHRSVEEGEWVAIFATVSSTYRKTGERCSTRLHAMARFRDGLMVEGHNLIDTVDFFEQVGLLPHRTLDQLLLGQKPAFMRGGA